MQQEEMLTVQVKNTMLQLNGQNLKLAAKNGRNSKTPGLHLSATHAKEAMGRLTASPSTQEGAAQLDTSVLKPPISESHPLRRPLKLAPLELPEEVREAQRQKLKFIQQEVAPAAHTPDLTLNEPQMRKPKSCIKQRLVKATVRPSAHVEPLKALHQNRSLRPQLSRTNPIEQNGDKHLEDVVCRGTPAPLCSKPAPPLLSHRIKAPAARGGEAARQNHVQQETRRRRLRLRRAQCLEEDQCCSNTSTRGLSADEGKLAQGVRGKGQRAEGAWRGQPQAGNGIKDPPASTASWECASARKSHREDGSQQSVQWPLSRQSAECGNNKHTLDGVKPSTFNGRLKRKKNLDHKA